MQNAKAAVASLAIAAVLILLSALSVRLAAQSSQPTAHQLFAFPCTTTGKPPHPVTVTCPMGDSPSRLIQSIDGNFYGATGFGGTGNKAAGTVFKLSSSGQLTTLYTFVADANGNYPSGANPGGVIEGTDGFLYGSTIAGLASNTSVIFRLSKSGAFQVVHIGGASNLTFGADGNLYGFGSDASGNAALVRVTLNGMYQVLHTFNPSTDGIYAAGLILGSDGNLYGTTIDAEALKITSLFRCTSSGQFTVLRTIHYGQFLVSAPIQSEDGNLYAGLDFVVASDGSLPPGLLEHNLTGTGSQLIQLPYGVQQWMGEIFEASDGNFWGSTSRIGPSGAIVTFTHSGKALHQIDIGGYGVIQASDGTLVGEAGNEIFALEPALPAPKPLFVRANVAAAKVGSPVMILGSHFLGAKSVAFNGVSASFKVLNAGNIVATVPAGATTGPIEITNAGGVGASAVNFTIE